LKPLNWGIVSTGRICEQFTCDLKYVNGAKAVAVAARRLKDAENFAHRHGLKKAYEGYQALFDDVDIDIIYIGTPHTCHFQQAYDAIKAGKHVLCEKPITISVAQMKELSDFARSQGVLLMEAMWTYFLPAIQQAKSWVEQGRIGKVLHIKADFGYPMVYNENNREYSRALAGGCLLDMGIYPLAIAGFFLDELTQAKWHVNSHFAPNGVDDDVTMLASFSDIQLNLATSFRCKLNNYAYIIGEKGYIEIPNFWQARSCDLFCLDDKVDSFVDARESQGLNYEAQAFTEAVSKGITEHSMMSHAQSLWLQEQMEAIKVEIDVEQQLNHKS
jgi:predicted dehydrogenase